MTTITLKLGEYGENLLKTLAQKDHQTLRVISPCAETESLIGEVDKILDNIGGVMEFSEEDTNERKMLDKLVPGLVMLIVNTATLRLLEQQ